MIKVSCLFFRNVYFTSLTSPIRSSDWNELTKSNNFSIK